MTKSLEQAMQTAREKYYLEGWKACYENLWKLAPLIDWTSAKQEANKRKGPLGSEGDINIWLDGVGYQFNQCAAMIAARDEKIKKLEAINSVLTEAHYKNATEDHRGNRSTESVRSFRALEQAEKMRND